MPVPKYRLILSVQQYRVSKRNKEHPQRRSRMLNRTYATYQLQYQRFWGDINKIVNMKRWRSDILLKPLMGSGRTENVLRACTSRSIQLFSVSLMAYPGAMAKIIVRSLDKYVVRRLLTVSMTLASCPVTVVRTIPGYTWKMMMKTQYVQNMSVGVAPDFHIGMGG